MVSWLYRVMSGRSVVQGALQTQGNMSREEKDCYWQLLTRKGTQR